MLIKGAPINSPNGINALTHHLRGVSINRKIVKLLLAAGEKAQSKNAWVSTLCESLMPREKTLLHLCRESIRGHLLEVDPYINLFYRVPKLEIPLTLQEYLLYGEDPREGTVRTVRSNEFRAV